MQMRIQFGETLLPRPDSGYEKQYQAVMTTPVTTNMDSALSSGNVGKDPSPVEKNPHSSLPDKNQMK
jgi:hypothetical protein